jgi:hypothetical protein
MEILEEDHYFYTFWRDEKTGEHFLETTCGRTAVFMITIKLTANEMTKYHTDPQSIRALAQEIVDAPDRFLDRKL